MFYQLNKIFNSKMGYFYPPVIDHEKKKYFRNFFENLLSFNIFC